MPPDLNLLTASIVVIGFEGDFGLPNGFANGEYNTAKIDYLQGILVLYYNLFLSICISVETLNTVDFYKCSV